jgi:hypothetical protein
MGKPAGLIAPADCRFHLLIAMIVELYPQMRVGSPGRTQMAPPQQPSPRRRPQILDDQTRGAHRFDASEYEDTWAEDLRAEGSCAEDSLANDDNGLKRFMARLTDLIRSMGGRK